MKCVKSEVAFSQNNSKRLSVVLLKFRSPQISGQIKNTRRV